MTVGLVLLRLALGVLFGAFAEPALEKPRLHRFDTP